MADQSVKKKSSFLQRLKRDEAGNVLAIFAAAIIPAIGLIGGGVDASRIYLVKSRLQAACDAGSLMGRKVMDGGDWSDNSFNARTQAEKLFAANFKSGDFGSYELTREFTENSGDVTGVASVKLPMTLMKVMNQGDRTISVDCTAELRIPNTDVMMVLDVTGSMDDPDGFGSTKIEGLRLAASCFYEALAKKNIDTYSAAQCGESGDPSELNDASASIRFGFVPYNVNVNVGRLLPQDYLADTWSYQSRIGQFESETAGDDEGPEIGDEGPYVSIGTVDGGESSWGSWYNRSTNISNSAGYWSWYVYPDDPDDCALLNPPPPLSYNGGISYATLTSQTPDPLERPATEIIKTYTVNNRGTSYQYRYVYELYGGYAQICRLQTRNRNVTSDELFQTTTPVTWPDLGDSVDVFARWSYQQVAHDVSSIKNDDGTYNSSVTLPIGTDGTNTSVNWAGCIEERQTFKNTDGDPSDDWDPIPGVANDMDIDLEPDPNDAATLWGPHLPGAIYKRFDSSNNETTSSFTSDSSYNAYDLDGNWNSATGQWDTAYCPTEAQLVDYMTADEFDTYMKSLSPDGNTYHDIGLIWGGRILSANGIFAENNELPDSKVGQAVERHLVFMTDGDTTSRNTDYSAYGLAWWDRRQSTTTSDSHLEGIVDARMQAICSAIKANNVTVWVVAFGSGITATTRSNLESCASGTDRYFDPSSASDLTKDFKSIASAISNLRLTR